MSLSLSASGPSTQGTKGDSGPALGAHPRTAPGQPSAVPTEVTKLKCLLPCPPHHLAAPPLSQQTFGSQKATSPTQPPCSSEAIISSGPSALSDRPPRGGKHFSKLTCECAGEEGCWLHGDARLYHPGPGAAPRTAENGPPTQQGRGNQVWLQPWGRRGACLKTRAVFRAPGGAAWDSRAEEGPLASWDGHPKDGGQPAAETVPLPLAELSACLDTGRGGSPLTQVFKTSL